MAIEGTGIKSPSKKASRIAMATYKVDPMDKVLRDMDKAFKNLSNQESTGAVKETGRGMGDTFNPFKDRVDASDQIENRPNFFSPGGGAFDERNNVQVATAGDFSGTFNESDFQGYMKALDIKRPKALPPTMIRMLKQNYQDDVRDGRYKEGQLINQTPKQEKPSFVEQTKNLAGSIFNTVTGTQPAAASQIPGGMPTGTQFTSSNLDAAKTPVGDTSFASYRMAGQPSGGEQQQQQQQQGSGIVTPFSQTSMGKGGDRKVTPFSETSMGQRVSVTPTTTPKTVTIDGQTVAARQTVASLPSDYKQTEAREFAKAAAFKEAQGIAKRNPNVKVGVDSKGQPRATAVQKTRSEAGPSARTAQGNQARVKQNAQARAQAAAVNRKLSGTKPKTAKERAQDAAKARKAAGPNRKMSAGQVTRSQAGPSARTAQGNRARVKSNARKRAQAAAKKRRAKKKSKKK